MENGINKLLNVLNDDNNTSSFTFDNLEFLPEEYIFDIKNVSLRCRQAGAAQNASAQPISVES